MSIFLLIVVIIVICRTKSLGAGIATILRVAFWPVLGFLSGFIFGPVMFILGPTIGLILAYKISLDKSKDNRK